VVTVGQRGVGREGEGAGQQPTALGNGKKGMKERAAEEIEVEEIVGPAGARIGEQAKALDAPRCLELFAAYALGRVALGEGSLPEDDARSVRQALTRR